MINERLSKIMEKMWSVNENKLTRNVDYALDLQNNVEDGYDNYSEPGPLITYLDIQKILRRPTFRAFVALLDNYEEETGVDEQVTNDEIREENRFLDACLNTQVMREAHKFLVREGKCGADYQDFKELLYLTWFDGYSRSAAETTEDSSAFEHVFVGEKRGNKVLGSHNWLDYFYAERKGETVYRGYVGSKTRYDPNETTDAPGTVAIKFEMNGQVKNLGGFFIGLSPEFELAMYTIVFLCSGQTTHLRFANLDVTLECFKMNREGRKVIATLYPA